MIGVSFQPGSQEFGQGGQDGQSRPTAGSGVQEAIRVLSLRLPKVVGAQSPAAMPLLTSQGSGGNPMIDSIVNQILSRIPQQGRQASPVPAAPRSEAPDMTGPVFTGAAQPTYQPQQSMVQQQAQQSQGPTFEKKPLFRFWEPPKGSGPQEPQEATIPNFNPPSGPDPRWMNQPDPGPFTTENYSI
jgi:hypothetical protein